MNIFPSVGVAPFVNMLITKPKYSMGTAVILVRSISSNTYGLLELIVQVDWVTAVVPDLVALPLNSTFFWGSP